MLDFVADDESDEVDKILKEFDMNMTYRLCLGLRKMEHWKGVMGFG